MAVADHSRMLAGLQASSTLEKTDGLERGGGTASARITFSRGARDSEDLDSLDAESDAYSGS